MKVTQKLNVPVAAVYQKIVESIQQDILEHTGKQLSFTQLIGFKYEKKIAGDCAVEVEIIELKQEEKYQFLTITSRSTFHTCYEFEALTINSCQIHYTEHVSSNGRMQTINDQLMVPLYSMLRKKRIRQLLKEIEKSI